VEIEFYCVIARKVRAKEFDIALGRKILVQFRRHLSESRFQMIPIQSGEYSLAGQWMMEFTSSLRSVDALHLAAASNNDLTLLTADKILASAAHRFEVKRQLIP
jgi:predicted nucleic acid-binding protein